MPLTSLFGPAPNAPRRPVATLLSGPTAEPVSLAEAKAWLKVESADDDLLIGALVTAARLTVEATARRLLLTQGWRLTLDAWPASGIVKVELGPVQAMTALRSLDDQGIATSYDPAGFQLDRTREPARILPLGQSAPVTSRLVAGVEIDLTLGYGASPTDVPQPLRQAMLMLVALWYENRGDRIGDKPGDLPADVLALIAPYRRLRI